VTRTNDVARWKSGALVAAVFALHMVVGFVLYRGRVVSHWWISDTDLVVFAAPLLAAAAGYHYAFGHLRTVGRIFATLVFVAVSTYCCLFWSFNTYGT